MTRRQHVAPALADALLTGRPMRRFAAACLLPCAAFATPADDVGPTLGKERAAASRAQWEVRETTHARLGKVPAAITRTPVETRVGDTGVLTRALVSCDPASRRMAIELANEARSQSPGARGQDPLKQPAIPVLVCSRPIAPWDAKLVHEELLASWDVDPDSGAALAQGLRPFPLRECVAIRAEQRVTLPDGKDVRVDFEIHPYARELDTIFTACGERSAYAPVEATPVAAASVAPFVAPAATPVANATVTPKAASSPAPKADSAWRRARVTGKGKSNIRAGPSLGSPIVAQVPAGAAVMVQSTESEWFRAKATRGGGFSGYIRGDRLAFD